MSQMLSVFQDTEMPHDNPAGTRTGGTREPVCRDEAEALTRRGEVCVGWRHRSLWGRKFQSRGLGPRTATCRDGLPGAAPDPAGPQHTCLAVTVPPGA